MAEKKSAAPSGQRQAAKKSISSAIVHPNEDRRQFLCDVFGRTLTAFVAVAEFAGNDRLVDGLLAHKSAWLKRRRA